MASGNAKEKALEAVRQLPSDATIEDVIERLYFLAKVERGLQQADSGDIVQHKDVKRRLDE